MWAEVEKAMEEHEGVFIRVNWADFNGIARGFVIPAHNAKSLFFNGLSAAYGETYMYTVYICSLYYSCSNDLNV